MGRILERLKDKLLQPKNVDTLSPFLFTESSLYLLDQRKLPQETYLKVEDHLGVRRAIKEMVVRGAPAIGIVAAIGFYLGVRRFLAGRLKKLSQRDLRQRVYQIYKSLVSSRPTAINLVYALNAMKDALLDYLRPKPDVLNREELQSLILCLINKALLLWEWELSANLKMGHFGKNLLPEGGVLTHCNTGALATGGYGTALGVIRASLADGKNHLVYVDETRPFLQGTRLTAWELSKLNMPYRIITDNSAGFLMQRGLIKAIIVGADRIAKNGDTANKIGTYSLAVLAKHHGIPFYVAAPSSSFDLKIDSGEQIPLEERSEREVLTCGGRRLSPKGAKAMNLAFDLTPGSLITAIITEKGLLYPPFAEKIPKLLQASSP